MTDKKKTQTHARGLSILDDALASEITDVCTKTGMDPGVVLGILLEPVRGKVGKCVSTYLISRLEG